ncbi:MAG: hypothetical protein K6T86_10230 [Pirellulales bacterium]|nr:hypothetical protein [Pirellulales bacterium]
MAKSPCPITRAEFAQLAQPIEVVIAGQAMAAQPKEFSTGSLGWNANEKVTLQLGGHRVTVQVGLNLTIVGSKELPRT